MSRIFLGKLVRPRQVSVLCAAISLERSRRLELLLAYLRDCAVVGVPAGLDERHFILRAADQGNETLVGTMAAEFELIASECAQHEDIRQIISDLARMIRRHNAELLDAAKAPLPFSQLDEVAVAEEGPSQLVDKLLDAAQAQAEARSARKASRTADTSHGSKKARA